MSQTVTTKTCTKCGIEKPLSDFYRQGKYYRSDCKKCKDASKRTWYANNNEYARSYLRNKYAELTPEQKKAKQRAQKATPRYLKTAIAAGHKRRAMIANRGVFDISKKELDYLLASPCAQCGSTENVQVDHIVPIARGGRHSIGNLQPLCAKCNQSKGAKFMVEFRRMKAVA